MHFKAPLAWLALVLFWCLLLWKTVIFSLLILFHLCIAGNCCVQKLLHFQNFSAIQQWQEAFIFCQLSCCYWFLDFYQIKFNYNWNQTIIWFFRQWVINQIFQSVGKHAVSGQSLISFETEGPTTLKGRPIDWRHICCHLVVHAYFVKQKSRIFYFFGCPSYKG